MKELWDLIGESKEKCSLIQEKKYNKKYDDLYDVFYSFYNLGLSIVNDTRIDKIRTMFFFSKNSEDEYEEYKKPLPFDINFTMSRYEIRKKLGNPDKSRDKCKTILGIHPPLDSYIVNNKKFSIEYLNDCSGIRLVCVSSNI